MSGAQGECGEQRGKREGAFAQGRSGEKGQEAQGRRGWRPWYGTGIGKGGARKKRGVTTT